MPRIKTPHPSIVFVLRDKVAQKATPRLGGGIFLRKEAAAGSKRMAEVLIGQYGIAPGHFDSELDRIANQYIADKKHDAAPTLANLRDEALRLRASIDKSIAALKSVSPSLASYVEERLRVEAIESPRGQIKSVMSMLSDIQGSMSELYSLAGARIGAVAIPTLCKNLGDLRSSITEETFSKTRAVILDEYGNETDQFKSPDMQFVYVLARALDHQIRRAQIKSAFIKKRTRQGKNPGDSETEVDH